MAKGELCEECEYYIGHQKFSINQDIKVHVVNEGKWKQNTSRKIRIKKSV